MHSSLILLLLLLLQNIYDCFVTKELKKKIQKKIQKDLYEKHC